MGIGKYGKTDKLCKTIPFLTAEDMGKAWEMDLFTKKTRIPDKKFEVFFSVEYHGKDNKSSVCGYMHRTKSLDEFFDRLIQDCRSNQYIEFVEWEDKFNCVVCDGIYISQVNFFMTKEEFEKFVKSIIPATEKGGGNYVEGKRKE